MSKIISPIIRDVFTNKEDALNRAKQLGCESYRTYNVDGTIVYVPCTTALDYEKAVRLNISKGETLAIANKTGNKFLGIPFSNVEIGGDPFLSLGNFSISKSISIPTTNTTNTIEPSGYTAQSLADIVNINSNDLSTLIKSKVDNAILPKFNYDTQNVDRFVLFSSMKEKIRNGIIEITKEFPAAIRVENKGINYINIKQYSQNISSNTSIITIYTNFFRNPFAIEYSSSGLTLNDYDDVNIIRNFSKYYNKYCVYYNQQEYNIIGIDNTVNGELKVTVDGLPFKDIVNNDLTANTLFYIKPNIDEFNKFHSSISDIAKFLLNYDSSVNQYKTVINIPEFDDKGNYVLVPTVLYFPIIDEVNIDLFSNKFDVYISKLNEISDSFDAYKTNLISRFLTTDSLKEFDTYDRRFESILQLYGRSFDAVKIYVDSLSYMRNVSYDKIDNIPDLLLKNYASMLGWETAKLEDDNSLIQNMFKNEQPLSNSITPEEFDIEIWRRLLINTAFLFKSKGTRKSIETLLEIVGIPDYIIDINEYVYLAEKTVNPNAIYAEINKDLNLDDPTELIGKYPFDENGFPTIPNNKIFQQNGGYIVINSDNIGQYDNGKNYIDAYRTFEGTINGFDLIRDVDNTKVNISGVSEIDNRLVINSKEVDIYLTSDRVIDYSIYRYFKRNRKNIDTSFGSIYLNSIIIENVSFAQFIKDVLNSFISVRNRKTILTYPTLTKLFYDYSKAIGKGVTNSLALGFINQFDTYWVQLLKQFIPATSIINTGKRVKNSEILDNKFVYKTSGDDGGELINDPIRRNNQGQLSIQAIPTLNKDSYKKSINPFNAITNYNAPKVGNDTSVNIYRAKYYSNKDDCERGGSYYQYDTLTNYIDSSYGGNINILVNASGLTLTSTGGTRYGVFVIYENELYRLRTINNYDSNLNQLTSTGSTMYPTNSISGTTQNKPKRGYTFFGTGGVGGTAYLDTNNPAFEFIPRNTDSTTITFIDCPNPTYLERQFFIDSISRALAYLETEFSFDCPPPKPHTCYFNLTGNSITISGNSSGAGYVIPPNAYYTDNSNSDRVIRQPYYYGFSSYTGGTPTDGLYYKNSKWVVPYRQQKNWTSGTTYYQNDIIKYLTNYYIVTGTSITATGTTPSGSGFRRTNYVNGLFSKYSNRTVTDPLMHIETAYIDKVDLIPQNDTYSFNLTKLLSVYEVFSGSTIDTTYRVNDTFINDTLYVDNGLNIEFDGLYSINDDNIGPFYIPNDDKVIVNTLINSLDLLNDVDNYISIASINTNFETINKDSSYVNSNIGYYLIKESGYFKFEFDLYFESFADKNNSQKVIIKLVDSNGVNYNEQSFIFNGGDIPENRVYSYIYEGFFKTNNRVYLVVNPVAVPCKLSRYETIDYEYNEFDTGLYDPLNDGRFRLIFNNGRLINGNTRFENGLSIQPLFGKADSSSDTLTSIVDTDNYLLSPQGQYGRYVNLVKPKLTSNNDPTLIFNKLYSSYYKKFRDDVNTLSNNSLLFDKDINYDKLDFSFSFTTRKKPTPIENKKISNLDSSDTKTGDNGLTVIKTLNLTDYYLGNTPTYFDNSAPSFNITIGKSQIKRENIVTKTLVYAPNRSYANGSLLVIGTGTTTSYELNGTNNGLLDYPQYDYNGLFSDEYANKNYTISGLTYVEENPVYNTEIYLQMLALAEPFSSSIVNYKINDIVKYKVSDYKRVNRNSSGLTIETIDVYRLFVCIEEITNKHCKVYNGQSTAIISNYHPNAGNSCFVEITKYDPKYFSPWGYEKWTNNYLTYQNIQPYTYGPYITYTGATSTPLNINYGDLVNYNNKAFRYTYNRPIAYYVTNNNMIYYKGDVVQYLTGSTYNFFICNNATGTTNAPNTSDWNIVNPFTAGIIQTGATNYDKNTVLKTRRLPNILPKNEESNTIIGWNITSGITTGNTNNVYINEIINLPFNVIGDYGSLNLPFYISGSTGDYFDPSLDYTTFSNEYFYTSTLSQDNILLGATIFNNQPMFEELCDINMINNPLDFSTGQTYNAYQSPALYKYVVSHGKLWRYKGTSSSGGTVSITNAPYLNSNLWDDVEFCLSSKFKFYKDRVKAKIYSSDIVSLTDSVKSNLFFYDSLLNLKDGFTTNLFSGSTFDAKLTNALDKYEQSKDVNLKSVSSFGTFSTRLFNKDLILDYTIAKDSLGLPRTGEFIGKLSVKDVCGNNATTIFGLLLDTDVSKLGELEGKYIDAVVNTGTQNLSPYYVRAIVNYSLTDNLVLDYTGQTMNTLYANNNTSIDKNIAVLPNTDLYLKYTYPIGKSKTKLKSIKLNGIDITTLTQDRVIITTSVNNGYETKLIRLKNNVINSVIVFDSDISSNLGIDNLNIDTTIKIG
jgi:hypothetical protein